TPPQVTRILRRCLVKDPKQRLRDIGDARLLLDDTEAPAPSMVDARPTMRRAVIGVGPAAALLAAGMLVAGAAVRVFWPAPSASAAFAGSPHLHLALPGDDEITAAEMAPLAISPDGSRIAYSAAHNGRTQLYERALGELEPRALPGTEGAQGPFFSPDGQWIGFFRQVQR